MTLPALAFYMHDLSGGGVERMRLSLIAALRRIGHPVCLIVRQATGDLASMVPPDLPVFELGGAGTLADVLRLYRVLRRERPALLFSSLHHNNLAALLAGPAAGVPVVVCQHNALSSEAGNAAGWRYRVLPVLYRLLLRRAAGCIAVSAGVADDFATATAMARDRIEVIFNPVLDHRFTALAPPPPPHPWLANPELRCFVFAGRLVAQKDPQTLLRAFARLNDPDARLLVLGDGAQRASLSAQAEALGIAARVCFAGFVADPLAWMAHAAAFVLCSRHEGFGNVLVEALACGTPVIASDCPHGPREILGGGRFGRLVPPGDVVLLAAAMAEDQRARFPAAACRARAAAFSAERCAQAHAALADAILRARATVPVVFGLRLSRRDAAGIADKVLRAQPPRPGAALVVTPNIDHVRQMRDPRFRAAYATASLACPDGFPVALYAWWRGWRGRRRVTGCDIVHALFRHPGLASHRLFVVVESDATQAALLVWARAHLPQGVVAVAVAPPLLLSDAPARRELAAAIRAHRTSLLLMTLGAPTSEVFVAEAADLLPPCWALCVGQAVRVALGLTGRGPAALQSAGLEWLWRVWSEPRRLSRRYLAAALWYPVAVIRDRAGSV